MVEIISFERLVASNFRNFYLFIEFYLRKEGMIIFKTKVEDKFINNFDSRLRMEEGFEQTVCNMIKFV